MYMFEIRPKLPEGFETWPKQARHAWNITDVYERQRLTSDAKYQEDDNSVPRSDVDDLRRWKQTGIPPTDPSVVQRYRGTPTFRPLPPHIEYPYCKICDLLGRIEMRKHRFWVIRRNHKRDLALRFWVEGNQLTLPKGPYGWDYAAPFVCKDCDEEYPLEPRPRRDMSSNKLIQQPHRLHFDDGNTRKNLEGHGPWDNIVHELTGVALLLIGVLYVLFNWNYDESKFRIRQFLFIIITGGILRLYFRSFPVLAYGSGFLGGLVGLFALSVVSLIKE
ncbi:hypothetical protein DFH27DRAFT_582512 [Peziza echinospora]|nr:hypothetical protein DFH27DRAFT_582512 [Peziza echinospora]